MLSQLTQVIIPPPQYFILTLSIEQFVSSFLQYWFY